jgi:hypothetical protein
MEVLDVAPGASSATHRLLVGDPVIGRPSYTVTLARREGGLQALDTEELTLTAAAVRSRPEMAATLPKVMGRVTVTPERSGLVLTAVPGAPASRSDGLTSRRTRELTSATSRWLTSLWEDTSGPSASVELGAAVVAALTSRCCGSIRLGTILRCMHSARLRIRRYTVPRTVTHGCLCPAHVTVADHEVIGVDDWSLGSVAADPLQDLGRFAARVADVRLAEVLTGRTAHAGTVRGFVTAGLDRLGVPAQEWRDVLLLAHLEFAAESLQRGDHGPMSLLCTAVREMPRETLTGMGRT